MDSPNASSSSPMTMCSDGDNARFTMRSTPVSGSSSQQEPEQPPTPQVESVNDTESIQIEDDDENEDQDFGTKRKLRSVVWNDFKKVKVAGEVKAQCKYCHKQLGGKSKNETKHLHDHLKICTLKKIKLHNENKTLSQSALRFSSKEGGGISVENYAFDLEVARRELAAMIVLHEYPLSMVDHAGFRRFVSAIQPLFHMVTRNTIRKDIMDTYAEEKKEALDYMAVTKSRVAITSDLWASENQRRGYMAVTTHFIDDAWVLRNIIMRFIYVPTPHTVEVISEELYEALVEWNIDEKISTLTLDNCSTNDKNGLLLEEVVDRLKLFNDITEVFSGTNYVTTNVQLLKICEVKEQMKQWAASGNRIIQEMSVEMIAKFDKYWKEIQGPMGLATILDPRFKTDYLLGFIETLTGQSSEDSAQRVSDVTNTLYDLMKYEMDDDEDNTESSIPARANSGVLSTISARVASRRPASVRFKSELDRYLEDELVPIQMENFQILDWWKVAGTRYPVLRKVARDIYAIPVSTVASESAFSTSGRVVSEHRSRLTPDILEALMCSQDWLRNKYRGDEKEETTSF